MEKIEIMIVKEIDSNLGMRESAKDFFKGINSSSPKNIIINFKDVEFIANLSHMNISNKK